MTKLLANPQDSSMPSDEVLRKAANLLQAAHDTVEALGFNIHGYGPIGTKDEIEAGRGYPGPVCYIGALRYAAGLPATPCGPASEGDGPELVEAFKVLDKIAMRRMNKSDRETVHEEYPEDGYAVGRFVEALGFKIADKFARENPGVSRYHRNRLAWEQAYALRLLRRALTEIHTRLAN